MDDFRKLADFLYTDTNYVCIFIAPPFESRPQRFVKASDLKDSDKWWRFMRAANANDRNVYASVYALKDRRSRSEENVVEQTDIIFLDFDSELSYKIFRADYPTPSVAIQTSPGKHQVFLKTPMSPKGKIKTISEGLSRKYNADHCFDLARVCRVPGLRNIKYPNRPLARITEWDPANVFTLEQLTVDPVTDLGPTEKKCLPHITQPRETPRPTENRRRASEEYGYDRFLLKADRRPDGTIDQSRADIAYSIYLLSRGYSRNEVKERLQTARTISDLVRKKAASVDKYLELTISRAADYQSRNYSEPVSRWRKKGV